MGYGQTGGAAAPKGPSLPAASRPARAAAPKVKASAPRPSKGPGRGGLRNTPTSRPAKPAKATYTYMNPMSDQQITKAAGSIADAQTTGPLDQLARQIARNNQQALAAQQATTQQFQGLGQRVDQSNQQLAGISGGLNSQLAQIGQDTQGQLAQAYKPSDALSGLNAQGLGGGGLQTLATALANAQGSAAQNAGTFRSFGATQGANAQSLGTENQGTFATRGQELLGSIGRAGQLRNAPLADKQSSLIANRGNLYASAVGKLQQTNQNLQLSRANLGLKDFAATTGRISANASATNARTNWQNALTNRNKAVTDAEYKSATVRIAQINAQLRGQGLSETQRHNLATEKTQAQSVANRHQYEQGRLSQTAAKNAQRGGKVTGGQRAAASTLQHHVTLLVQNFRSKGVSNTAAATQEALKQGYTPAEINIARDIAVNTRLSPPNRAAALQIVGGQKSLLPPNWGV